MKSRIMILILSICFLQQTGFCHTEEPKTLPIGSIAPDFKLKGIDSKTYSLASFSKYNLLVVIFTCNHCPTAQAYEDRIIELAKNYTPRNVGIVAVSPNDPAAVRLDELGYTDMSDSFEEMKIRAKQKKFNFPYLYDGDKQSMSNAYGPVVTPHVFIFDKQRKLRYQGRIDDVEKPGKTPNHHDTRNALDELLQNKEVTNPTTKVFGCSIKWADKNDWVKKGFQDWAKEPVSLELIDEAGIKDLLKNNSGKLRLINVWATWCGPCLIEFSEFVTINRMYRERDFEFISICLDDTARKQKALNFLKSRQASNKNYLFNIDNKYALIEAVDPNWQGALPYTLIVEPGGKIFYAKQYLIDPAKMKKMIVDHPLIGRYY
ncbi:redoxin family protein [Terrimonas pollutisoli]|uniref:redoxin family protein n=1 Tax=Terrimonas pollutisoli TaxID=3034147 RepID=UPI0023ED4CA3|nr:redoxin family protein [Terrimonas sp. H1YJ31]